MTLIKCHQFPLEFIAQKSDAELLVINASVIQQLLSFSGWGEKLLERNRRLGHILREYSIIQLTALIIIPCRYHCIAFTVIIVLQLRQLYLTPRQCCMHTQKYTYVTARVHNRVQVAMILWAYTCIHTHECTYINTYPHTHVHTHTHIHIRDAAIVVTYDMS